MLSNSNKEFIDLDGYGFSDFHELQELDIDDLIPKWLATQIDRSSRKKFEKDEY